MWTKLSADKKSELMKAYKKGGFSYRDMIDDYNNSYEEFENGGKTTAKNYYATSPEDYIKRNQMYNDSLAIASPGINLLKKERSKEVNGMIPSAAWAPISDEYGKVDISKPYARLTAANRKEPVGKYNDIHASDDTGAYTGSYGITTYKKPTQKVYPYQATTVISNNNTPTKQVDNKENSFNNVSVKPKEQPIVLRPIDNAKYQTSGGGKNYYNVNGSWVTPEEYNKSKSKEINRTTGLPINMYGGIQQFKNGGKVEFNSGGETHVVYRKESPTGNGKGIEGHIMINHPTKDKGKWDTIDLTDISNYKVKTIDQGIASTKKWHAENPEYKMGGMIKRADGSYSKRGLWDNIRANKGSGKAPTKEMLRQERRIKNKYEEGGKVNTLEGDLISKVIMNRNRDKDFVQRAYAVGEYPNSNMFVQPDANQFGDKNSHLMSYGEDDNGQSYMFPTIFNDKNEAVKVPNQYADYISNVGYKNATGIPTYMYGGIQKYQKGGIEDSINKRLGDPMNKAQIDSDYKRPTVDPRTRRQHEAEPVDNVRHAAAGRYTQEAIENYANLIPYASAIPGFSKAAGFIGSNILGLGHEASTLLNKNDDDTRPWGLKLKESAADAYNNMIGSVIGASNLTPYQKNAYIKYLSETGKIPTGQYNKKKDPIYKKQTNKK